MSRASTAAVAKALGGRGRMVEDRESLAREIEAALGAERYTVIACRIDGWAYDGRL